VIALVDKNTGLYFGLLSSSSTPFSSSVAIPSGSSLISGLKPPSMAIPLSLTLIDTLPSSPFITSILNDLILSNV